VSEEQQHWQRVHRGGAGVVGTSGRKDPLYRAGKPLGERIRRVIQRIPSRRVLERTLVRIDGGSKSEDRILANRLQ
jgi:hypothetical protein